MITTRSFFGIIAAVLLCTAARAEVSLGILADDAAQPVAEALVLELSQTPEVALLERADLKKLLAEQSLALSGITLSGSVKVGQLAKADALLILRVAGKQLQIRCVSVAGGIIEWQDFRDLKNGIGGVGALSAEAKTAVKDVTTRLRGSLATLKAPRQLVSIVPADAIFTGGDAPRIARTFSSLVLNRLAEQPGIAVLERQQLEALAWEGTLVGDARAAVAPVVIRSVLTVPTLEPTTLTAKISIKRPGGTEEFEAHGPRTKPEEVAEEIARQLLKKLTQAASADVRKVPATEEAAQFTRAAQSAEERGADWHVVDDSIGSAWALGDRSEKAIEMRALSLLRRAYGARIEFQRNWISPVASIPQESQTMLAAQVKADPGHASERLLWAAEALKTAAENIPPRTGKPGRWLPWKIRAQHYAVLASHILRVAIETGQWRNCKSETETLRAALRQLYATAVTADATADDSSRLITLKLTHAGFWADSPEAVLALQRAALHDALAVKSGSTIASSDLVKFALEVIFRTAHASRPFTRWNGDIASWNWEKRGINDGPDDFTPADFRFVATTGQKLETFRPSISKLARELSQSADSREQSAAVLWLIDTGEMSAKDPALAAKIVTMLAGRLATNTATHPLPKDEMVILVQRNNPADFAKVVADAVVAECAKPEVRLLSDLLELVSPEMPRAELVRVAHAVGSLQSLTHPAQVTRNLGGMNMIADYTDETGKLKNQKTGMAKFLKLSDGIPELRRELQNGK